jgi:hypothetical protein
MTTPQNELYNISYNLKCLMKLFETEENEQDLFENVKQLLEIYKILDKRMDVLEDRMDLIIKLLSNEK